MTPRPLLVLLLFAALLHGSEAQQLARQAARAARAGRYVEAFTLYSRAAQASPYSTYAEQSRAMLAAAAAQHQVRFAEPAAPSAATDSPPPQPALSGAALPFAAQARADALAQAESAAALLAPLPGELIAESKRLLPPLRLDAHPVVGYLAVAAPARKLWDDVLERYGLAAVFDESVTGTQPVRLELQNAGYREAIRSLELGTGTIAVPVGEKLLLVTANTPNAQAQLEPVAAVVIPLPQALATEDATEIANAIRQAMEIRTVMVDASRRMLLLRDRYSKVIAAQAIAEEMMHFPQDVVIEVELREVSRRNFYRYGINLPTSFPVTVFTTWMRNVATPMEGYTNFLTFGGGASLVGIGLASAEAVAFMRRSDSVTLYQAELRGASGKESTFSLGQEYPILKAEISTGSGSGGVSGFNPQVEFKQLGITLKMKPVVQGRTVTMDLSVTVALLTGESSNGIPVLANRETATRLQVEDGQLISVAGLLAKEEARGLTGLAGLNQLPGIGAIFRQTTRTNDETEVLLVVRPRVQHARSGRTSSPVWWTGTSTRFITPL